VATLPTTSARSGTVRPAAATLSFRWTVSPDAARAAGLSAIPSEAPAVEVVVPWTGDVRTATAEFIDGPHRRELAVPPTTGAWTSSDGMHHLDLPGVLTLSVRAKGAGVEVVYARTPLLAALRIPGGCAEFAAAAIQK
jgi:hypothetical protein